MLFDKRVRNTKTRHLAFSDSSLGELSFSNMRIHDTLSDIWLDIKLPGKNDKKKLISPMAD